MNVRQAFAALGMAPTDDVEAIRATYRRLAKQLHPDVQGANGATQAALRTDMRLINQARDVLLDASERGPLVAAADPVVAPAPPPPSVDDLWRQAAPPPQPAHGASPAWWDPRSVRARRSCGAAVRWLCAVGGLGAIALLLGFVRVPAMDQAFTPSPSSTRDAVIAAASTTERQTLDTLFVVLQLLYPVCVVKWCIYAKRSFFAGAREPGLRIVLVALGMIGTLAALWWGWDPHGAPQDGLVAGNLTQPAYAEAIESDHGVMSVKAGGVAALAVFALICVARSRQAGAERQPR